MASYSSKELKRYNHLVNEIDGTYHEISLKLGLSDSAMIILYTICNQGDHCLLADICRWSGLSKQTINSALRKLEAEGIVYLEASGRRKKRVCLTEQGRKLAEETVVKLIEIENGILDSWSRQELEQYLELTRRYLDSFRAKVRELEPRETGPVPDAE